MFKSNFFHFRQIQIGSQSPFHILYGLGQSNETALPTGGICVGAFLTKDGFLLPENSTKEQNLEADGIIWAISRASDKENYWKKKARQITRGKAVKNVDVLISRNHDYPIVKQIANELARRVDHEFRTHKHAEQFWNHIKNSFSIDAFVDSGMKTVDNIVSADPLNVGTRNH